MTKNVAFLVYGVAMCLAFYPASAIPAADVVSTWDGTSNNWTSNYWSSANFPNNGNGGFTYDAVLNSGAVTLDQNIAVQNFTLSGGTLTATANFELTTNDLLSWTNGTMSGTGQTTIASGGSLAISQNTFHNLNRLLVNNGSASWTVLGDMSMTGGTFQNNGSFTANSSSLLDSYSLGGTNVFNNAGTFTKLGAGSTAFSVPFNNTGTVTVYEGKLSLLSGGPHMGDFNVADGARLGVGGDTEFLSSA